MQGLLIAVVYPVAKHRLQGLRASIVAACGLSSYGVQVPQLWPTGSAAPWHVGSFQTRDRTHVPSIGRWILNHWTTREVQHNFYMHWKTRRLCVTCFIVILALVQWPGIKATVSPRYACEHTGPAIVLAMFAGHLFWLLTSRLTCRCQMTA